MLSTTGEGCPGLSSFPEELQTDIAERIGTINRTSPTIINKIETIMNEKLSNLVDTNAETVGGVKALVEILNSVDRTTEKNIISDLEARQPELADEVKANLFIFEDISSPWTGMLYRGSYVRLVMMTWF